MFLSLPAMDRRGRRFLTGTVTTTDTTRHRPRTTMELLRTAALLAAVLTTGLMAGLYFSYSCSVMPGLRRTDDQTFIATMRSINDAILNGWFFLAFVGALVLTGLAGAVQLAAGPRSVLPWTLAALVLYGLTIVTTGAFNVPLNDDLMRASQPGQLGDPAAVRAAFEATWVRWNLVRTGLSIAAFGCLAWALVLQARPRS
jgi:uncharacterized membrane protein